MIWPITTCRSSHSTSMYMYYPWLRSHNIYDLGSGHTTYMTLAQVTQNMTLDSGHSTHNPWLTTQHLTLDFIRSLKVHIWPLTWVTQHYDPWLGSLNIMTLDLGHSTLWPLTWVTQHYDPWLGSLNIMTLDLGHTSSLTLITYAPQPGSFNIWPLTQVMQHTTLDMCLYKVG